ncbi:ShlB/FhaC/HecB family hemolysin secretion/activation protein [Pseudohalioglobus lutimaris]|uniref:ShlB/FhaC/HecB family hemolysin secretion/activation protein n=1 Tax=Pseudohalioglobus lutimaris TaxID=1737061 RepID=A0A2N5WY71_9GAMM|nr:ShlB/FhaC/HecB family hemolysin secretion/activation protein [Pseudohalioglobus lutimaris]PLW67181.1 ShlB/FhaC/HecB family hemolysin secretion/activation protein [Pseudohalioglobus lutimaris]
MQLLVALVREQRRMASGVSAVLVVACCCLSMNVVGQPSGLGSGLGQNIERGFSSDREDFDEPSFDLDAAPGPNKPVPQVLPSPSLKQQSGARSNSTLPVSVTSILVNGNTVFSADEIAAVVAPFENRELSPENLQELLRRLSLLYFNAGYVNSGVVLPDGAIAPGTLALRAIEGELQEVQLLDNERLSRGYLEPRLRRNIGSPLNLDDLQNSLRMLELNPLVRQVNGVLVPGLSQGTADLRLRIKEEQPLRLGVSLDNYRSPSVGAERALLTAEHLNISGRGDRLALAASYSEGLKDAYLAYQLPLNSYDTRLDLEYQRGDSRVIEAPFDDLDIESDTESWGVSIRHPLVNSLDRYVTLNVGLYHSESDTSLLGKPFSFSLGARNGEIAATNVSVGGEWIERGDNQVLALRSTLRYGLDWFGATMIPDGAPRVQFDTNAEIPESQFTVVLTQLQYARRLPFRNSQLVFSSVWQYAFDPLLSVEKMAIGGRYSVRGFRENQLVRDNGLTASLEWRVPIFVNEAGYSRWNITAVPFVDYGRSWDEDSNLSTSKAAVLSSVGLGLRWQPKEYLNISLFYGERISDDDVTSPEDNDLQDDGFHFALTLNWPYD